MLTVPSTFYPGVFHTLQSLFSGARLVSMNLFSKRQRLMATIWWVERNSFGYDQHPEEVWILPWLLPFLHAEEPSPISIGWRFFRFSDGWSDVKATNGWKEAGGCSCMESIPCPSATFLDKWCGANEDFCISWIMPHKSVLLGKWYT